MRMATAGLAMLWFGLFLGAVSIFATHPLFAAGVWSDAEPLGSLFFMAAGICCAGLGVLILAVPDTIDVVRHPFVLVSAALGILGLLAAPFVEFPLLSILGPPQTAQGALWYLAFAAFVASALVVRSHDRLFMGLVATAAFTAVAASLFNLRPLLGVGPTATLLGFNEHLAYHALGLIAVGVILLEARERRAFAVTIIFCGLVALVASRNRTAMIAIAVVGLTALALRTISPLKRFETSLQHRTHATYAIILAIVTLLGLAPYFLVRFVPAPDFLASLWSRQVLFRILEPNLFESIEALSVGHGWGHYSEYLVRNFPIAVTRTYETEWRDVVRDQFHSHNAFLEALFSAGLPGLVATVGLPVAIVMGARRSMVLPALAFVSCWAIVDGAWFMMPSTMVALALCIGLSGDGRVRLETGKRMDVAVACFAGALLTLAASIATYANSLAMTRLEKCLPPNGFDPACGQVAVPGDPRGASVGIASLLASSINAGLDARRPLPADQNALLLRLLEDSRVRMQTHGSVTLAMARYNAYARALNSIAGRFSAADDVFFDAWQQDVHFILRRAPHRLDILPTYLNLLLAKGREDSMRETLAQADRIAPHHPIAMWFTGTLLLRAPDAQSRQQGLTQMRRALANGLENFMPVPESTKARLAKTGGG